MIRLSSLIVCASILACAMSQSGTTTSVVMTSSAAPHPTPVPTPTPEPEPVAPNDYRVKTGSKVCLRMVANITVKFEYFNSTDNEVVNYNYTLVEAGAQADQDRSHCVNPSELVLSFNPPGDEDPNYMVFTFAKTSDGAAWQASSLQYNFTVTKEEFDGSEYVGRQLSYNATKNLVDGNVGLESSYQCSHVDDVQFDSSSTNNTLNLTLTIIDLQVQPFFDGDGTKGFGDAQDCVADAGKGNKIVPIAVGAALAGLVIVVLIAYLIGRLKSRRQSSYEALS